MTKMDFFAAAAMQALLTTEKGRTDDGYLIMKSFDVAIQMEIRSNLLEDSASQWSLDKQPKPLKPTDVDPRTTGERGTNE